MCSWYTYKYILVLSWWPGVTAVTSKYCVEEEENQRR